MYGGAAVSFAGLVIGLATASGLKSAIRKAQPTLTAAQVDNSARFIVAAAVISGLIGAALWLWMAWANKRGKSWARILSSVFFAVSTLNTVAGFARPANRCTRFSPPWSGSSGSARSSCSGAPMPAPTTGLQAGSPDSASSRPSERVDNWRRGTNNSAMTAQARLPERASDSDHDHAIAELRERSAAGELSHDTFVRRMDIALRARSRAELAALFCDLSPGRLTRRLTDAVARASAL